MLTHCPPLFLITTDMGLIRVRMLLPRGWADSPGSAVATQQPPAAWS